MSPWEFVAKYDLSPEKIPGESCLAQLLEEMAEGLAARGNIPMFPSFLPLDILPQPDQPCCVLDAGGTNLRAARAVFDASGRCTVTHLQKAPMPGTQGELSYEEFYGALAQRVRQTGCAEKVGFCFSYNLSVERHLDGILEAWCKEVRVPQALHHPVGASLQRAVGSDCRSVRVLNDSVAALLGAHAADPKVTVGLILGTGINVCYLESCGNIPKLPQDLRGETMIISTEIGEFRGIPKTEFDLEVIASSDDPALAQGEKQCAGAYLGAVITSAWKKAREEGVISYPGDASLPQISDYMAGKETPLLPDSGAKQIAATLVHRAAKIAAILTAGAICRSRIQNGECTMVIEGSQFEKLTGFADHFRQELDALMRPRNIRVFITKTENSCLMGAALAAFADPM